MASKLLTTFFLFIFFLDLFTPFNAALIPISSAIDILSDSGYFSMGLTLQLANTELSLEKSQKLTIFAPSDKAFSRSGQPSLLDFQYQLSLTRLPGDTLKSLPRGAKIPSLRCNSSLIVTDSSRSGGNHSINNVVVHDSPVFDNGYLVIYGTDQFFATSTSDLSPNSPLSSPDSIPIPSSAPRNAAPIPSSKPRTATPIPSSKPRTATPIPSSDVPSPSKSPKNPPIRSRPIPLAGSRPCFNIFESASKLLMSRGFVIMATFLALQLESSENDTRLTVFAPMDEAIADSTANFSNYATIFKGHVIQRLLSWKDLQELAGEGSILHSVLKGFDIELSWSGDILLLNGVPVIFPDLYVNEWITVHGLNQMITPQSKQIKVGESFSELDDGEEEEEDHEDSSVIGDYVPH